MSQKPSKPWEKRPPGGREGAEWEERKASRPARGDPTCAWESLPAATGHAVSRRQDGDVSRRLYWIHNILACGMNRWLIWCVMFQSGEARCFCWPKTSSVQVWTEDSWQRDNGIFKSIPVISVCFFPQQLYFVSQFPLINSFEQSYSHFIFPLWRCQFGSEDNECI